MRLTIIALAILATASTAAAQTGRGGGRSAVPAGAQGQTDVGAPLVFEIMVRQYGTDNQATGSAGTSLTSINGRFDNYVWTTSGLCGLSSSKTEPASVPNVGWHFTGEVVGSERGNSGEQLTVNVEWKRLWSNGVRLQNGPGGSQRLMLRNGERIELDRVLPAGQSPCDAANARLEASVVTRPAYLLGVAREMLAGARDRMASARGTGVGAGRGSRGGGVTTGVMAGAAGGVNSGTGVGSAAGTGAAAGAGGRGRGAAGGGGARGGASTQTGGVSSGVGTGVTTGTVAAGGAVAAGRGGGGRGSSSATGVGGGIAAAGYRIMSAGTYDAELWLVHRKPDGNEVVQQQTVRFSGPVAQYNFPPVQVQTSRGPITLDIAGKLQTFVGEPPDRNQPNMGSVYFNRITVTPFPGTQPPQRIMLSISRRARAAGAPLLDITGGSSMAIDMPAPTDVLSFEFPALQKATEDLLKGHVFSLRVRVTAIAR